MESSRNRAEKRVWELTENVNQIEIEYNSSQNAFHYNNSKKENEIDSLASEIVHLNSDLNSNAENIEGEIFSFQIEKRRLNQLLVDKDKEIRRMNSQISALDVQVAALKNEGQESHFKIRNTESENKTLNILIVQKVAEIEKLRKKIDQKTAEIVTYETSLSEKDEQIKALQNQVNLLKSQFGQQ